MSKRVLSVLLSLAIIFTSFIVFGTISANALGNPAGSFAAVNGQLKIAGNQLCNAAGSPIQLRGESSAGVCWYGNYINANSITWLRDDWKINCFRVAMYTEATGGLTGYTTNTSANMTKVKEGIEAAINAGIYVLVDWHILSDGDPNKYKTQAKSFFTQIATTYGSYPNIIYEICNEPNGADWNTIKTYANEVIPVIRNIDPDGVILVGTPTWSQDVDTASASPLSFSNIAYVCHFYAGTHGQYLRDKISTCLSRGYPVFVSEWGTSQASGDGGVYPSESDTWLNFLDTNKISHMNWSLCDKAESSAALNAGASTSGGWSTSNLSTSGNYVRNRLRSYATTPSPTPTPTATPTVTPTPTPNGSTSTPTPTPNGSTATPTPTSGPTATPNPNSGIKVQFFNGNTSATTNTIYPNFKLVNTGTSAITLSSVKMRYYFTNDGTQSLSFQCDYANVGSGNITGTFTTISKTNADRYFEVGFTSAAGTLAAGASTEAKIRVWKSDWSNFTQTNDYSFNSTATNYVDSTKTTGYVSGALGWGTEP